MTVETRQRLYTVISATLLLVLGVLAYLPSFDAWFFLDDFRIILENPALQNVLDPKAVLQFSEARFIASLSFAANYTLHGESVFGYHLVNFVIHCGAAAALGLLLHALLRTPAMSDMAPPWMRFVPWIAAAIFLLHPLQTQAVTYIVQRYTSLMAMFYLASLATFAWARLKGSWPLFGLTIVFGVLALLSKQTAATLPIAIVLIELLFYRRLSRPAVVALAAASALGALLSFWLLTLPQFDIAGITRETWQISRIDYLATQMEVLWRYLGLFFLIGEQRLEYSVAVAEGFAQPLTMAMALGHLVVIGAAFAAWRKAPLVAFSILFCYLAHTIESSFLPIIDVAFEHRTYLPNAGLALVVGAALAWLGATRLNRRLGTLLGIGLLVLLVGLTHARNSLWADQIDFLRNETRLSPDSQRAWTSLGKELMRKGRFEEALQALQEAAEIAQRRENGALRPPTLLNIIFALHYTGRNREAVELALNSSIDEFNKTERAFYFEARGRSYLALGQANRAQQDLTRSARLNPTVNAMVFLAAAEYDLGRHARASQLAREVLQAAPNNRMAREIIQRTRNRSQSR